MDLQDRVNDLESRLAFQDDTIETLNDILVTQQRAVERLQMQMTALLKRQEEMGGQVWGMGIHDYKLDAKAPWMSPEVEELTLLISHQDQVTTLPENATVIASSAFCPFAAYHIGDQVLCFQMRPLSDEDKLRALQLRASRRGLHLTDEVGHFILTRGTRSMSALFDLLERLDQASLQAQRKLTIPFLKETLGW